MNSDFRDIDELIGKYLAGEATGDERSALESWLLESPANKRYFDQSRIIFDRAATVKDLPTFDTDAAWNKVRAQLHHRRQTTGAHRHLIAANPWLRVAASVVIVLGIGFFAYRLLDTGSKAAIEISSTHQSLRDTLPDGSTVVLNRSTQLAYSDNRGGNGRQVELTGEAYFTVQHDDTKSFVVKVGALMIRDIGTSFNVKAYPDAQVVEVVVEEGEVVFYNENDPGITLKAGEKGVYQKDSKKFRIEKPEPNVTAYKSKSFVFADAELASIIQDLNSVYDTPVVISDRLARCRLTVSFNNEDIRDIAEIIAETLALTVTTKSDTIVLEGNACEN